MSLIISFGASATDLNKLVKQYVAAVASNDFEQATELMHPDALSLFKEKINNSLQSRNQNLVEKELLPLLGVNSRKHAAKLTGKEAYIEMSKNLMKKFPNQELMIANSSVEYIEEVAHGDTIIVTCKLTYNVEGQLGSKIVQVSLKKYKDNWRILLTPDTLAYFELYT